MKKVNVHEAKTHLSRLIEEAASGKEIVIAKAGKPMVKLVPVAALKGPRPLGLLAGKVRESEDCWVPDPELEELFYGGDGDEATTAESGEDPEGL